MIPWLRKFGLGARPWAKYAFTDNAYIKAFYDLAYTKPDSGDAYLIAVMLTLITPSSLIW
jgi:hypothetical protein